VEIDEKHLRSLIRAQILFERFDVDLIPVYQFSKCELKVPASWNRRKAALLVGDLADIYGIPGSFCTMLSAMIPGNYEESKKKKSRSGDDTGGTAGEDPEKIEMLVSVKESLEGKNTVFLPGINTQSPNETENVSHYNLAKEDFKTKLDTVDGLRGTQNLSTAASVIVRDIFRRNGNTSDVESKAKKLKGSNSETSIVGALCDEAKLLMKHQATRELARMRGNTQDTDVRNGIDEYTSFVKAS